MKRLAKYLFVWCGLLLSAGLSFAQTSKIAPDLLGLLTGLLTPVNVVVQYNSAPSLLDISKLLSLGGVIKIQYTLIPGVAVQLPSTAVTLLAPDTSVSYISLDRPLKGTLDNAAPAVGADLAFQSGLTGAGVGIAIIDSGIYAHPDV